jgi:hypothetical protein
VADLRALQHRFSRFLRGKGGDIQELIAPQGKLSVASRLGIYRNAYRLRLRETIETDHEILGLYLGDELFEQMVDGYIERCPSRFFSLRDLTTRLPGFLRQTPPFADHPVLAELASFERRLLDVFDAPDASRAHLEELRRLSPDHWPDLQLRYHPSMQLFTAQWNSVECWRALKTGGTPPEAIQQPGSHWLLWRGCDQLSQFRSLPALERSLIVSALAGAPLSVLCEQLAAELPEDQVGPRLLDRLGNWLEEGLIQSFAQRELS